MHFDQLPRCAVQQEHAPARFVDGHTAAATQLQGRGCGVLDVLAVRRTHGPVADDELRQRPGRVECQQHLPAGHEDDTERIGHRRGQHIGPCRVSHRRERPEGLRRGPVRPAQGYEHTCRRAIAQADRMRQTEVRGVDSSHHIPAGVRRL